jgi:CheY-like chemotaxis protein
MMPAVSRSVLVVDDDPAFCGLARRLLIACGLTPAGEAGSAAAAVVAAAALEPDAVLVDVRLPDRDGIALAHELAALPWRPRIVLTSTNADAATATDVERSGAVAFVAKDQLPNAALYRPLTGTH